jgi:hypothetical protein
MGNTRKPTVFDAAHPQKSVLYIFIYSFIHSLMSEAQDTDGQSKLTHTERLTAINQTEACVKPLQIQLLLTSNI